MKKGLRSGGREGEVSRREDIRQALALWEQGLEVEQQEREQARLGLLSRATKDLANFFKDKQVEKVYLTGSLLREDGFYAFSDIDLAVEGLQFEKLPRLPVYCTFHLPAEGCNRRPF